MPTTRIWVMFQRALLLGSLAAAAGCTAIPLVGVKYRPNVVEPQGAAITTPVALMAAFEGRADDSFLVHNFYERADRWFPDRIVIFNEKDAGARAVVALTDAKGAVVSGFFNAKRVITLKGYVKAAGQTTPTPIESTYTVEESLPALAYVTYVGGWAMLLPTLFFVGALIPVAGIAFAGVSLLSYILSQTLLKTFESIQRQEQQNAVDMVYSAAVNSFLNVAWTQLAKGAAPAAAPTPPVAQPPPAAPPSAS